MIEDFSALTVEQNAAKIAFAHVLRTLVNFSFVLFCGFCTLVIAQSLLISHICDSAVVITVHFGETNCTACVIYFFYSIL